MRIGWMCGAENFVKLLGDSGLRLFMWTAAVLNAGQMRSAKRRGKSAKRSNSVRKVGWKLGGFS